MAEAMALIGLAASIVTLVDVTQKAASRLRRLSKALPELQAKIVPLADETALLLDALTSLQAESGRLGDGGISRASVDRGEGLVKSVQKTVGDLEGICDRLANQEGIKRLGAAWKLVGSKELAKEIEEMHRRLAGEKANLLLEMGRMSRRTATQSLESLAEVIGGVEQVRSGVEVVDRTISRVSGELGTLKLDMTAVQESTKRVAEAHEATIELHEKSHEAIADLRQQLPQEILLQLTRHPTLLRQHLDAAEAQTPISAGSTRMSRAAVYGARPPDRNIARRYCSRSCPCVCHEKTNFPTIGGLKLTSSGVLSVAKRTCTVDACRPARLANVQLSYFPKGWLKLALQASFSLDFGAGGVSIAPMLKVRRILAWDAPVFVAARRGDLETVKGLIERGEASVGDSDDIGWTALHCAADNDNLEVAKYLTQHGGDVNAVTIYNETPTTLALRHISASSNTNITLGSIVRFFFDEGFGLSPDSNLAAMSAYADLTNILDAHIRLTHTNISTRKDVDFRYEFACTPLMIAIVLEDASRAATILEKGADPRARNEWGQTPLHLAARRGFFLPELLETPAVRDVNAPDNFNQTPLITAARNACLPACEALLRYFPDPLAKSTGTGYTALHWAVLAVQPDIVSALLCYDDSPSHLEAVGWLGRTPLLDAVEARAPEVLRVLLAKGANVFARDAEGNSGCHIARDEECAEVLVRAGLDVDTRGARLRTPVMAATMRQDRGMVEWFVRQGCNLGLQDQNGWSVLHYAQQPVVNSSDPGHGGAFWKEAEEVSRLCVEKGAEVHQGDYCVCQCSRYGCTATTVAAQSGSLKSWMGVVEATGGLGAMAKAKEEMERFRAFVRTGLRHTCCQGSLFVQPYTQVQGGYSSMVCTEESGEEDEEYFRDAQEYQEPVQSQLDLEQDKRIAEISRGGCQTILLSNKDKRLRVDVKSLVAFKDWEVLIDV